MCRLRIHCLLIILLACIPAVSPADVSPDEPLPRDPNNVYGTFDNGLSYIVRRAPYPSGKVTLNLRVNTGALNETDQQNGLAHFLEHMAFKGSKHFEPMQLIPLLSHLGMTFGADTNAHTNLTETVFKLTMPDNKPETIDTALTIFSDYASGLSLYPIQIESERRVILEEARTKKNVGQRLNKQVRQQLFEGTPLVMHDVIGDEDLIKTFPPSQFVEYWNTWYRPENMTLVVAGDINPGLVIAHAREKLGGFTARAEVRPPISASLKPFTSARALIFTDPEQIDCQVMLECIKPMRGPVRTYGQFRRRLMESIAETIVNRRFSNRVALGSAPYRSAGVESSEFLHQSLDVSAEASGQDQDWQPMLGALVEGIHGVADHGFTSQEYDLATRGILSNEEWATNTESSQDSKDIVQGLIAAVDSNDQMLSARQKFDLTREIFAGLTKEQVQQAFAETFDTRNFAYVLLMPPPKNGGVLPTGDQVLAAASADWAKTTIATEETAPAVSLLSKPPVAGKVILKDADDQLGITTVVFNNGVVLHHKFLDSKKDEVFVSIKLPGGIIEETATTKGLSSLASQIISHPATHRLDSTAIRDLMTGKNVSVGGSIGLDALTIEVKGSPTDLSQGLQLANAILCDGVLEKSAVDEWKQARFKEASERRNSAKGQLLDAYCQTVAAGDIRLNPLTAEQIDRLQRAAAQQWFDRITRRSAIEVAVVGDLPLDQAIDLVGRYVGSLPKRIGTFTDLDALRKIDRPAGPFAKTTIFPGITPTAEVIAGYVGCDETDPDRRPLSLASLILTERMIQRIRIKDNLVYSISCTSAPGQGIAGMGQICASAPTDPKNADRLAGTILEMIDSLADNGPSGLELVTAKKQVTNILQTQMKQPAFWIAQLGTLDYHKHKLAELRQVPGVFDGFTNDQVRDTLKRYVKADREIRLAAVPQLGVQTGEIKAN